MNIHIKNIYSSNKLRKRKGDKGVKLDHHSSDKNKATTPLPSAPALSHAIKGKRWGKQIIK